MKPDEAKSPRVVLISGEHPPILKCVADMEEENLEEDPEVENVVMEELFLLLV